MSKFNDSMFLEIAKELDQIQTCFWALDYDSAEKLLESLAKDPPAIFESLGKLHSQIYDLKRRFRAKPEVERRLLIGREVAKLDATDLEIAAVPFLATWFRYINYVESVKELVQKAVPTFEHVSGFRYTILNVDEDKYELRAYRLGGTPLMSILDIVKKLPRFLAHRNLRLVADPKVVASMNKGEIDELFSIRAHLFLTNASADILATSDGLIMGEILADSDEAVVSIGEGFLDLYPALNGGQSSSSVIQRP